MIETIITYASMWAPSIISVLTILCGSGYGINKLYQAVKEFKCDETMKELNASLKKLTAENEELTRCNRLLLDQITRIKDYSEVKKGE